MDSTRFDRICKLFATRKLSRRHAIATSGAAIATAGLATAGGSASSQDATPAATPPGGFTGEKVTYLFVQSFQSGSIAPAEGAEGRYTVTLEQGLGQTIYFGDRPSRAVGVTPTPQFLEGLGFPADNPPNAALLVETAPDETDIAVVELYNPTYDEATHTATYEVKALENWKDDLALGFSEAPADLASLAPEFGTAHLLIDDCPDGTVTCYRADNGAWAGEFDSQPFCYNYGICMPCEPYGHDQPDRCATKGYWDNKCDSTFATCTPPAGCYSYWPATNLVCT